MSAEFDQVLADLWRGAVWAYLWGTDGPEHTMADGSTYREKDTLWFPVIGPWPALPAAWVAQWRNVYLCVHGCTAIPTTYANGKPAKRNKVRGRLEHISAVNCVFAEYDAKDYGSKDAILAHLDTLWFYPSCVVDSGGGFHCYWLLDDGQTVTDANRAELTAMQSAWVELVGGDDGAKDLARVLRLPGTRNMKAQYAPNFPTVHVVEYAPRRLYPFERIADLVRDRMTAIVAADAQRALEDTQRDGKTAGGAADGLLAWAVSHAANGSRHSMALWLAGRLKAEGLADGPHRAC